LAGRIDQLAGATWPGPSKVRHGPPALAPGGFASWRAELTSWRA
jgi:hypothetical protein